MTLGIQLLASRRDHATFRDVLHDLVRKAVLAERLGFDTVWLAEHHGTDWNQCGDPLTLLAHLAAHTSRVRLGVAVINLGLHHPARIAEQAALVNGVSGGRLELGIGRGFASADYERFGLRKSDSGQRFRANHDQLISLMAAEPETASVPVWLATTGNQSSLDLAADHGHGLLVATYGERLTAVTSYICDKIDNPKIALVRAVHVGRSALEATRELMPHLTWYVERVSALQPERPQPRVEEILDSFCIIGTGPACQRQLAQLRTTYRVTDLMCIPGIGGMDIETVERVLHVLAETVDE